MIPPYCVFEFNKLFLTVSEGGKKDAPLKGASSEKKGDILLESSEYVGNDPHIMKPLAFRPLF